MAKLATKKTKKNLMTPFHVWSSTASRLEPPCGDNLQHKRMKKMEKSCRTYAEHS